MGRKQGGVIKLTDPEVFTGVYAEIGAQIDCETAVKIYEMLKGQTITFPQKLYSREFVRSYIKKHRGEHSVRELAKMFGYSDRRIRQFVSEEKD